MKRYQNGGMMEEVPQGIQNVLMDREEERQREAFEKSRVEENKAPRKTLMETIKRVMGSDKTKTKPAKKMASGGKVGSASKRADGCAQRGKTKGRFV